MIPPARMFLPGIRLILGITFFWAGLDKIFHTEMFAQAVYNYRILPDAVINITAISLPWIELLVGLCLLSGIWAEGASLLSATLLAVFLGAILFNAARGLNFDCGCFITGDGVASKHLVLWPVVRDALLLLMALHLVKKKGRAKTPALPRMKRWFER